MLRWIWLCPRPLGPPSDFPQSLIPASILSQERRKCSCLIQVSMWTPSREENSYYLSQESAELWHPGNGKVWIPPYFLWSVQLLKPFGFGSSSIVFPSSWRARKEERLDNHRWSYLENVSCRTVKMWKTSFSTFRRSCSHSLCQQRSRSAPKQLTICTRVSREVTTFMRNHGIKK